MGLYKQTVKAGAKLLDCGVALCQCMLGYVSSTSVYAAVVVLLGVMGLRHMGYNQATWTTCQGHP